MKWYKDTLDIRTKGKGLYKISELVTEKLSTWHIQEGLCILYIQHTSASLLISESYDPTAKIDLENFMEKLAPEHLPWYRHTLEGADDSPSHIRAMITQTSETIPIENGQLCLGTWQGIYLFEHRVRSQSRKILIRGLDINFP